MKRQEKRVEEKKPEAPRPRPPRPAAAAEARDQREVAADGDREKEHDGQNAECPHALRFTASAAPGW